MKRNKQGYCIKRGTVTCYTVEKMETYGVRWETEDGRCLEVPDMCDEYHQAQKAAAMLLGQEIAEEHWEDVLDDLMAELYTPEE